LRYRAIDLGVLVPTFEAARAALEAKLHERSCRRTNRIIRKMSKGTPVNFFPGCAGRTSASGLRAPAARKRPRRLGL